MGISGKEHGPIKVPGLFYHCRDNGNGFLTPQAPVHEILLHIDHHQHTFSHILFLRISLFSGLPLS
jgi:hypothetical protein